MSPLWVYEIDDQADLFADTANRPRTPNLSKEFIAAVDTTVGKGQYSPEDVMAYIYAVLQSPTYTHRFSGFLKRDFPRVPLTPDARLFWKLSSFGTRLIGLHLMRRDAPALCDYPIVGNNRADMVEYREGRVYINADQYFDGVPESVWNYRIGGYQVSAKWLQDRKGRLLTYDDLQHYKYIIYALAETISIQGEIDAAIPGWPLQ